MSRYISQEIRDNVVERAGHRCEYCRSHSRHSFLSFHIEHVISVKHGGKTVLDNLAYSCPICNYNKGTDIATFLDDENKLVRFYHPRKDIWEECFELDKNGFLIGKTEVGLATIKLLDLNHPDMVQERNFLVAAGIF